MKPCIHCGAPIHDEAAFCHVCAKAQAEKAAPRVPRPGTRKILRAALALALGVTIILSASLLVSRAEPEPPAAAAVPATESSPPTETPQPNGPKVYDDGTSDILYTYEGKGYYLAAGMLPRETVQSCAKGDDLREATIGTDERYRASTELMVVSESKNYFAHDEFHELVSEVKVTASPISGEPLYLTEPEYEPGNSTEYQTSYFYFSAANTENEICWEIEMKNGDTIRLRQTFAVNRTKILSYSHWEYPMNTAEELQELINRLSAELSPSDEVTLYLPPVVYEGGISIDSRSINLSGSSDSSAGVERTTFLGTVEVNGFGPNPSCFQNIAFEVPGGTGVLARQSVVMENCVFRNCDTGTRAEGNSWICSSACLFEGNGIGIDIANTGTARLRNPEYLGMRFFGNDVAFRLCSSAYDNPISFNECQFSDNGENVQNFTPFGIEYTDCIM